MTASHEESLTRLQQKIWNGSVPLEIRLTRSESRTFGESDPYFIQTPRLSYLPFLLPQLHAFVRDDLIEPDSSVPHHGWFSYEDVPLKWHYPLGLLYDLYAGAEPATAEDQASTSALKTLRSGTSEKAKDSAAGPVPGDDDDDGAAADLSGNGSDKSNGKNDTQDQLPWRLTVHFSDWPVEDLIRLDDDGKVLLDAFRNSVKEASFVRHGTGKVVMSLGYEDSMQMWKAVENHNRELYVPVQHKLLNPPGMTSKHLPIRLYLPSTSPVSRRAAAPPQGDPQPSSSAIPEEDAEASAGTLRIIQALVPPTFAAVGGKQQPQTLGMVLNTLLPALFPSRRSPLLALPVLHGAVVPLAAAADELARSAAYADGWLHLSIRMMS